tara:strand:- start:18842 stop:19849 length:1008 start_codon:yes stop_codon:yes gene_type:complete
MNQNEASQPGEFDPGLRGLGPIALEALLVPKVWGGSALQSLRKQPGTVPPIGEAWLLYDRPDRSNALCNAAGSLADLRAAGEADLMGSAARGYGGRFPVLVKYLHAQETLSLQVHPSDAEAIGDGGKEECWLVLEAGRDAKAYVGLKDGVDMDCFVAGLRTGELEELLNVLTLKAGDVVHVPPGTVHALGGDALVLEVQQNSDMTHRLSDWGRGRATHVDAALKCIDVHSRPRLNQQVTDVGGGGRRLVATPSFHMFRYQLDRPVEITADGGYCVLVGLDGGGSVTAGGHERAISREALLVPACHQSFFVQPSGGLDFVICAPGDISITDCDARH